MQDPGQPWPSGRGCAFDFFRVLSRAYNDLSMRFLLALMCAPAFAQWIHYPTPGIPRTPDGKPNLAAPAPKTTDGKPDLSGLWQIRGLYIGDIAKDLKPGSIRFAIGCFGR